MRALVTGGHGFIGTHLVRLLLEAGVAVRCLSRRSERPASLEGLDVEVLPGDIRRSEGLDRALQGVDEVYHLAGLTSSLSRSAMDRTNVGGTRTLLDAAARAGVTGRFVFCSSLSALGPVAPGHVPDESEPCAPITWYGASKLAAEASVRERSADVPVTIVRPPAVYGPRDREWLTLFQAAARGFALLAGRPGKRYSFIHAADLARALVAAARPASTLGGTYFAAHAEVVSLTDVVEATEAAVGRATRRLALPESFMVLVGRLVDLGSQCTGRSSVLGGQRMREVATGDWTCSPQALSRDAGWEAQIGLRAGFEDTARWYREAGLLP